MIHSSPDLTAIAIDQCGGKLKIRCLMLKKNLLQAHSRKLYLEKSERALLWVPINDNLKHWEPLKIKVYERS
ncbi:hypothetical protein [Nostoc sp.]|uniref:hypothetical protein n=1 Tax=Nostoc sp. TaxID=1180 RepID=UPI002FFAA5E0